MLFTIVALKSAFCLTTWSISTDAVVGFYFGLDNRKIVNNNTFFQFDLYLKTSALA